MNWAGSSSPDLVQATMATNGALVGRLPVEPPDLRRYLVVFTMMRAAQEDKTRVRTRFRISGRSADGVCLLRRYKLRSFIPTFFGLRCSRCRMMRQDRRRCDGGVGVRVCGGFVSPHSILSTVHIVYNNRSTLSRRRRPIFNHCRRRCRSSSSTISSHRISLSSSFI